MIPLLLRSCLLLLLLPGVAFAQLEVATAPVWNDSCMIDPDHYSGPESVSSMRLPPCSPTATNDNFAAAILLTLGAAPLAGTTCGTLEANEKTGCNGNADQTVWYKFIATATTTYVEIVNSGSCYIGSVVWPGNALPTDLCTLINCQAAANGPGTTLYQVNTVVGRAYAVQVTYSSGMVCGSAGSFNIRATTTYPGTPISNPPPPTNCSSAPAGCYFTSPPASAAAVTSTCTGYPLTSQTNLVVSGLYSFHTSATNSIQLSNQIVLNSTCVNGNIAWGLYKIYDVNCNVVSCGNIAGGNLSNVACNTTYFIQYMWEELSCTYTTMWPYQFIPTGTVGCGTLAVDLISFTARTCSSGIELNWVTASEFHNDHFTVERSSDGFEYLTLLSVPGNGTTAAVSSYRYIDERPLVGTSYYRLRQTDFDGSYTVSDPVSVSTGSAERLQFFPNPAQRSVSFFPGIRQVADFLVTIYDVHGCKKSERNYESITPGVVLEMDVSTLSPGIYTVVVGAAMEKQSGRIVIK